MMSEEMRPPINRAMRTLDRSFFKTSHSISAARIFNNKHISQCRKELEHGKDILPIQRLAAIQPDPTPDLAALGRRCILLCHEIKHDDATTWTSTIQEMVKAERIGLIPYTLQLDYSYWSYLDIMSSILPADEQDELPTGFTLVGHVAHLNLRDQYLPYKNLIAEVLIDKNPTARTVINKIDNVGNESEYRTFAYEVLAGPDDLDVVVKEQDCIFKFNYAKVYWNSRLHTEHQRLVEFFKEGEAVCDVMAGIGPFAVPAGKRKVFVWANDLNPESFAALEDSIKQNKVDQFVHPFNQDGHAFIKEATASLHRARHAVTIHAKQSRTAKSNSSAFPPPPPPQVFTQPRIFSHFVMNLPASATSFLPSFIGLYKSAGLPPDSPLPKIHVYCFSTKSDDREPEKLKICEEISHQLKFKFRPGNGETEGEVAIFDVRDVAPNKRMFCATFTLPREVAF